MIHLFHFAHVHNLERMDNVTEAQCGSVVEQFTQVGIVLAHVWPVSTRLMVLNRATRVERRMRTVVSLHAVYEAMWLADAVVESFATACEGYVEESESGGKSVRRLSEVSGRGAE